MEIDERFVPRAPEDPGPVPPGWVRVDFHMHTYTSGDAVTSVEEFGAAVERAALDVVCVTDHHAVHVARTLAAELDVRVIVGEELKTHEGEIIGLFMEERISFGHSSAQAAADIRAQGALTYVPHPIGPRAHAMAASAVEDLAAAGLLDAVEVFNARNPTDAVNEAGAALCTRLGLPGGAGSDAHYAEEIGAAWLVMPDFDGPAAFLEAMSEGYVIGRRHPGGRSGWRPRIIPSSASSAPDAPLGQN